MSKIDFHDQDAEDDAFFAEFDAMTEAERDAWFAERGIDVEASFERLRAKLLLLGIDLPPVPRRDRGRA